eukprot:gene3084-5254_t
MLNKLLKRSRLVKSSFHVEVLKMNKKEPSMYQDVPFEKLPSKFERSLKHRVFCNRNVSLKLISHVGFDMDYTLAVYNSPVMESMVYAKAINLLITKKGYPETLRGLKYDPSFAIRGLFVDKKEGNFLKIDSFGYVLKCIHGRKVIDDIEKLYEERFISISEIGKRYYPIDTMFALPEICLYSDIIEYFSDLPYNSMTYWGIFEDVNEVINELHRGGGIKLEIMTSPEKYIKKDIKIATLLERLRIQEKKTFLMTNSEFYFTNAVMTYLLGSLWKDFFDIVIVNAHKPSFFCEGTTLREVDETTGNLKLSNISGGSTGFQRGKIYNGGNLDLFKKFTKTSGSEVLYVGDSITHDVMSSKENRCFWRTCLLLRELGNEIETWKTSEKQYQHLMNLEYIRARTFSGMDSTTQQEPVDLNLLREKIYQCQYDFDSFFNPYFGSVFRSGSKETYYSNQVMSYADLYTSDCLNFLEYPLFYYFTSHDKMYPHERQTENLIQKSEKK